MSMTLVRDHAAAPPEIGSIHYLGANRTFAIGYFGLDRGIVREVRKAWHVLEETKPRQIVKDDIEFEEWKEDAAIVWGIAIGVPWLRG